MNAGVHTRRRVAMIAFDFGEVCVPIANALSRSVDVMLALPHRELEPVRAEVDPAVQLVPFFKPRLRQPLRQGLMCRRLLRAVRAFGPDIVHLQQGHLWFNFALPLLGRAPLVVTVHDHRPHPGDRGGRKTPAAVTRLAFRRADQLIVHAEQLRREVIDAVGAPSESVHVVPHVAIGAAGDTVDAAQDGDVPADDGRTVLFFGRIWPYKGLEYLIRAQPQITAAIPDARFVIAGQGEDFDRYRRMMADPSRFTVLNEYVSNERRAALFAEAAVVVLPYIEASQSGVVPVAYTFGKPVVVTSVGGLPEAVEDGRTGLVVPPGDAARLADAIVTLLRDAGLRSRLGAAGRRKLEGEWSAERVGSQTLEVYDLLAPATVKRNAGPVDSDDAARRAAEALHRWLLAEHWRGDGLVGPDCGVRLNYRVGRFVKSYLGQVPWRDDLYYAQGQAYWILANWRLGDLTGDTASGDIALACSRGLIARQLPDGGWAYPNPEWRGRVANAEGSWAAIALVESYRRTRADTFLHAALLWHRYLVENIGFQPALGGLAANYFAKRTGAPVPNTTAYVLRLLAELADATGDDAVLERAPDMVRFLRAAQRDSGEMPYEVAEGVAHVRLPHFQCHQYNAFQCLDLLRYGALSGDASVRPIVEGILRFLRRSVGADGQIPYACGRPVPRVTYHAGAVAAALSAGAPVGETGCADASALVLTRLLSLQRETGSFPHSRGDYGLLHDDRSYPRHLAMLLLHLLEIADVGTRAHVVKAVAR